MIDHYEFGRIVIDGREERRDVILIGPTMHPNWWRREGHQLVLADLEPVLDAEPDVLVVGTGDSGNMKPAPGLDAELRARGIGLEALPTAQAVRRINVLAGRGESRWAAALHLTC